jgi:flagellar biosynthesis protein FliQ
VTDTSVIHLCLITMTVAVKLSAPILVTGLAVGFGISLFQSVTQIQEVTLSFVPKAVAVGIAVLVSGNWMLHTMVSFTQGLFAELPQLLG